MREFHFAIAVIRFNSTLVQLKSVKLESTSAFADVSFNSTLVQLKMLNQVADKTVNIVFQFHIGSIKNRICDSGCQSEINVSIPHWFN